jgi:tRNA (guanine-N7-)-methyltransferase
MNETKQLPAIEVAAHTLSGPDDWHRIFARKGYFHVEIGAGRDTLLVLLGKRRPDLLFLGFEYSRERVARLSRKIVRAGLSNVRLLRCEATQGIARFLAPGSVESFSVLFPDPWPKKRHEKHRLISLPSARLLAARLRSEGRIYLKTDDASYAARMVAVLEKAPFLRNAYGPGRFAPHEGLLAHETLYERKWRAEGRRIYALVYVRTEEP